MKEFAIAFDVGGTFVKSAILDAAGNVCPGTIDSFPAHAKGSKEEILSRLTDMIRVQADKIQDQEALLSGVGYAFPGPFDYENGICYIKDADKYESVFGVNLREELLDRLKDSPVRGRLSGKFDIVFENDAALFALGEKQAGKAKPYDRCICLTIGTGTGSAFLEGSRLVKSGDGVPPEGWVYSRPYRDSIVDEYISRRGILRLAGSFGLPEDWDVKELAEEALQGHPAAGKVFDRFGKHTGEMLLPYVQAFRANGIVIGGQIAKSYPLFDRALRQTLSGIRVDIAYSDDTSLSTYVGVYPLLREIWSKTGGETA
ncbi:MAG: hypothetical protein K0S39_192 [Paenibacillus sp.]|jgi:glucokinase|nr:hypothetical protein [Paenibacillus sp.]